MSKRLKSFHKLFFIVIFSILFSGVIGSSSSPDLPEKIAPELEQIEALPRRTKPAELNIEVTKIKSEPLEEVYIDRKNKNIYVDFSKKREQALKGVRNAEDLEKKYNLIISENIQSSGEVVGKGRTKMATNPQVMTYETAELDGKKMLKIPYENEPEKLYISVQENNQVIKVYSISEKIIINPTDITMQKEAVLNNIIIEDIENLPSIFDFGILKMTQIGTGINLPFPLLALGTQGVENSNTGWSFSNKNPNALIREDVISSFKNNELGIENSLKIKIYFDNKNTNAYEIIRGNPATVFGGYKAGTKESIQVNLKGSITSSLNLQNILSKFREKDIRELELSSIDESNNQISFVIGQFNDTATSQNYDAPAKVSGDLGNEKTVTSYSYPKIKLTKPLIEEKVELIIKADFDITNEIILSENGINTANISIKSDTNRYLKSLHYESFFTINNSESYYNIYYDGYSQTQTINLKDSTNTKNLQLEVQYYKGYPKFKIINYDGNGIFHLNIKHFDPSSPTKLLRQDYDLKITLDENIIFNEFDIKSNINDIVIRKENENFVVEYPENWINMTQLTKNSALFPIIALNAKEKWEIITNTPFNPKNIRPWANFNITKNIKVPINLKETPNQNIEKFFIYNIGELSNRNIAVGAYNRNELEGNKNKVNVDFKMDFSQENLKDIWNYAENMPENKVLIPYSTPGDEIHKLYAIKGIINNTQFEINSNNILKEFDFPKVYVLKGENIVENEVSLKFKNPIPKSGLNLKGTFDININGFRLPNDMPYTLEHPESLEITRLSPNWIGFSNLKEYHEIDVKILRNGIINYIKTITTNADGTLKDNIQIANGSEYSYVLKKGKNSLVAIGLENWDLNKVKQYEETLILEHKNSSGRVTHIDKYKVIISPFNIITYLALPNPIPVDKKLIKSIETETQRIPLIDFQLKNYDKDITIQSSNFDEGAKIKLNSNIIELTDTTNSNNKIMGKLNFIGNKSLLISPNEIGHLEFNITNGSIANGKTYRYNNIIPLVTMEVYNSSEVIINKLEITGTPIGTDFKFNYFNAKSNLKNIIVNDNMDIPNSGSEVSMGTVSLQQNGSAPNDPTGKINYTFPTIALGNRLGYGWEVQSGNINDIAKRENVYTRYFFEEIPTEEFSLRTFINSYTPSGKYKKEYIRRDKDGKIIITGCYGWDGDLDEKIESEIKLTLISKILERAREISGNRVILKAKPELTDNKIALIHSRIKDTQPNTIFLPTDNTAISSGNRVQYFNYKDIIIEKDSFTKNLTLKFLKTYINNTQIEFGKNSIITSELNTKGIEPAIYEAGVLYGVNFKNKIKIYPLDETILLGKTEYEIDSQGNLSTPIEIKMIKNGAEATLNLNYNSSNSLNALLSLKDIKNGSIYNIALEHIESSGDIRRKYNLTLLTNDDISVPNYKLGDLNFSISSRYNANENQLNSDPLLITEKGIKYPTEILDLELLNGDFPEWPSSKKNIKINGIFIKDLPESKLILNNGNIILKITLEESGDLKIKPLKWNYNATSNFTLFYEDKITGNVTNKYRFNIKCPEFFVMSSGELNFGKNFKFGTPKDKIVNTVINLEYNSDISVKSYLLDIPDVYINNSFSKILYLDDNNKLLVKDLELGDEKKIGPDGTKRELSLKGTLDGNSILNTPPGVYQKTIQILIHLR